MVQVGDIEPTMKIHSEEQEHKILYSYKYMKTQKTPHRPVRLGRGIEKFWKLDVKIQKTPQPYRDYGANV